MLLSSCHPVLYHSAQTVVRSQLLRDMQLRASTGTWGSGCCASCRKFHFCPMEARSLEWVFIQDNLREWFQCGRCRWNDFLCNFPNKNNVKFVSRYRVFHVSTHSLLRLPRGLQMGERVLLQHLGSKLSVIIGHALSAVYSECRPGVGSW